MGNSIATAADYADAMLTARRAKNVLVGLMLLILALQLVIFMLARFTNVVGAAIAEPAEPPAPALTATRPAQDMADSAPLKVRVGRHMLQYLTALENVLGVLFALVLPVLLLLVIQIMLIGRLIGVAKVTSAFVWCIVLLFFVLPWQFFVSADFIFPLGLYSWRELSASSSFPSSDGLRWWRFIGFPLVSIAMLLVVHAKSRRGLRMALGEEAPERPEGNEPEPPGDIR